MDSKIAVIGAGTMGHGIAEVFALGGYCVNLEDFYPEVIERAKREINESLSKLLSSGKITRELYDKTLKNINYYNNIKDAVDGAYISIEAVPEKFEIKKNVLSEISNYTDGIIASNTSNIRITELAEFVKKPERLLGMHFFNPPVLMKLVEVIKGDKTDEKYIDEIMAVAKAIGKVPIKVMRDEAGFIVNRVSASELLVFCMALSDSDPAGIDAFFKSQGLPMGPYQLFDYVGLDTVYDSLKYYAQELSPDYGKCKNLDSYVNAGKLGMKTGSGIYRWENGKAVIPEAAPSEKISLMDVFSLEINEATKLIESGIATPNDIETGVKLGLNRPFGPVTVAQGLSSSDVLKTLNSLYEKYKIDVFKPSSTIINGKLKEAFSPHKAEKARDENTAQKYIIFEKHENTGIIKLNNTKNNLIGSGLIDELNAVLDRISADNDIHAVLITGNGTNFSAGADLSQFINSPYAFMEMSKKGENTFDRITKMNKIFVAYLKGYVLGGGLELALACDIRVSSGDAVLGFPETSLGLIPGYGGSQRLPALIGISRAMDIILSAERINAQKAYEYGIITRIFNDDGEAQALKLTEELSQRISPASVYTAKRLIYGTSRINLDFESISMGMLYGGNDLKEGIRAFMEKRSPKFGGN